MEHYRATVLVVDDDPDVLRLVEAVLDHHGYEVLAAGNAEDAMRIVAKLDRAPDLLLTDVVMPGVGGPVLVDRLLDRYPDLRVLFMSGFDDRQVVQRYVVDRGYPLIPKPFTLENLGSTVRSIIEQPPVARPERNAAS